jgi:hypothetical protein
MAVLSEIVVGVACLSVLGLSVLGRDYLESLEYMGVGVSLFLIGFGLSLLWLKKHFLTAWRIPTANKKRIIFL